MQPTFLSKAEISRVGVLPFRGAIGALSPDAGRRSSPNGFPLVLRSMFLAECARGRPRPRLLASVRVRGGHNVKWRGNRG